MTHDKKSRDIAKKLVKRLAKIREDQGFSYDNLAMLTGSTKSTIHALETGKSLPNLTTCIKICLALNIKLSDLAKDADF